MPDLKRSRSAQKGALTRAYGDLIVLIAEEDYDAVVSERLRLKTLYLRFKESHSNYHETLEDEDEIQRSDEYFFEVQKLYAAQQHAAKTALNDMRPMQAQHRQGIDNEQSFKTLGHLINLPPLELQKFSGEPDEYDNFIATFNEVIGSVVTDPSARLVRLKSQVTGVALDSIKTCRMDDGEEGYTRAMKILRVRFGSPHLICNSVIERLKHGHDISTPAELRTFADDLANAEITLKNNNMYTEIDTQKNIIQICHRLESNIRYKWRSRVMKHKQSTNDYLNFTDFVCFVRQQADVVNDPLYGLDVLDDRPVSGSGKKSVTSLPIATHSVDRPKSYADSSAQTVPNLLSNTQCHLCFKNHKLYACYRFKSMAIDQRLDYVNVNNLCTLCFSKDHLVSECRSSYICKINNCGKRHSSALHIYDNQSHIVAGHCVQSPDNSKVYMPTLPVTINNTFRTFALLDTGSTTTFCTRRLVDTLKLQGIKVTYQLKTLHGSMDRCSEAVKFQLSSEDGAEILTMDNVLVVDTIPVEECSLEDAHRHSHIKDITFPCATQVDILIGQDNPAALVPIEVRRGPVGTPFATRTMMGWSLNGCASTNVTSHTVTSNFISTTILNRKMNQLCELEEVGIPHNTKEMPIENQRNVDLSNQEYTIINDHLQLSNSSNTVVPAMPDNVNVIRNSTCSPYVSMKGRSMVEQYDGQIDNTVTKANVEQVVDVGNDMPDRCRNLKIHAVSKGKKPTLCIVSDCTHVHKGASLNSLIILSIYLLIGLFAVLKFIQYGAGCALQKPMREINNPWCNIQTIPRSGWHVSPAVLTMHIEATNVSAKKSRTICSLVPVHALLGCVAPSIVQAKILFQETAKHKNSLHSNPLLDVQKGWERCLENQSDSTTSAIANWFVSDYFSITSCMTVGKLLVRRLIKMRIF